MTSTSMPDPTYTNAWIAITVLVLMAAHLCGDLVRGLRRPRADIADT